MGARIVIVSNRVAIPESPRAAVAGGLAVAVKAVLKNRNGLWFGWSGKTNDQPDPEVRTIEMNKITYALMDLSTQDFQEYYNGLANRVLWPILHYRVDLQEYSRAGWILTRGATPSTALVPQQKVGFSIPNPRLLRGFQGTKTARREGISSPSVTPGVALRVGIQVR